MHIEPFVMERYQSLWEHVVEYNLSESGVHPLNLDELLSPEHREEFLRLNLGYNQTNGSEELRSLIAQLYGTAQLDNILVTTGSAEANFLATWCLVEAEDEVAMMFPNYMQIWGIARMFGARVNSFHLVQENNRWQIDWDEFDRVVSTKTKLIAVCNPNNPTGAQLSREEIKRICERADQVGAWILADEVYRGAERVGETTASFWGEYDKVIVNCGLSKAYGLPGLRIGWMVAPAEFAEKIWGYHDYTTICPNPLSDRLACMALTPDKREQIINRTRRIVRENFDILRQWMERHTGVFSYIPPIAGAITLIEHKLDIKSTELVTQLRDQKSVLIVPGEHFFMDEFLRIGFGCAAEELKAALNRVSELIVDIPLRY